MFARWRKAFAQGCIGQRYVMSIMGFLGLANAYTMRVCLSVAITQMVTSHDPGTNQTTKPQDENECPAMGNETTGSAPVGTFDWDEYTQGLILSSFFWGYVISHLPGGILSEKFGGKHCLGLGILSTAIFTILSPAAAYGGAWWLMAVRIIAGLGEGPTFPALNALLAQWVPAKERGGLGTLVFAGTLIGTVAGNSLSGWIIQASGGNWELVFYVFGGIAIVWFIIWCLICYNEPSSHPFISEEEKKYLEENIEGVEARQDIPPTPWRSMATSWPLWGLIFAQIGHDWGFFTMVTDLPKYMKDVMKFNISQSGFLSSVPYVVMWLSSLATGWLADFLIRRKLMNTTNTRKLFTSIASVGPGLGLIAASYAGCDQIAVVILFSVAMGLMGAFYPGMKVNALDLSPNYAGSMMAVVNGMGAFTGIIAPYIVGVVAPNSALLEWRIVFWITFGVLAGTNLIFLFTASGEVQPWNNIYHMSSEENGQSRKVSSNGKQADVVEMNLSK